MLSFTVKDGSLFKSIFTNFVNEVADCVIMFDSVGMTSQAMDSSHVSLVTLKMVAAELFVDYHCTEPHVIGVALKNLLMLLKLADKKTKVGFSQKKPDDDTLTVTLKSENGATDLLFDLKLMDIDSEELQIPDDMSGWRVHLSYTDIAGMVKNMSEFGDVISLCLNIEVPDVILYQIKGDTGTVTGKLQTKSRQWVGSAVPDNSVTMKLSMRYMKNYMSCRGVSDNVELLMGNDIPICISYKLGAQSVVSFYVSPKIHDDE